MSRNYLTMLAVRTLLIFILDRSSVFLFLADSFESKTVKLLFLIRFAQGRKISCLLFLEEAADGAAIVFGMSISIVDYRTTEI